MKGKYLKPDGNVVEVLDYDEINKMVYIKRDEFHGQWIHDTEYKEWVSVNDSYPSFIPDVPSQVDEVDKQKKKTTKKKNDTNS